MTQEQATIESGPGEATAADFLALRNARPREPFTLPDGKRIWVVGLTEAEKNAWYKSCATSKGPDGVERIEDDFADARLVVRCVRSGAGVPLFTDKDLPRLIELPPIVMRPLVRLCMRVCAIGGEADAEILKNFAATLAAGS